MTLSSSTGDHDPLAQRIPQLGPKSLKCNALCSGPTVKAPKGNHMPVADCLHAEALGIGSGVCLHVTCNSLGSSASTLLLCLGFIGCCILVSHLKMVGYWM